MLGNSAMWIGNARWIVIGRDITITFVSRLAHIVDDSKEIKYFLFTMPNHN